jgi:hypothetical protein
MRSIEVVVPKSLIKAYYPHPEPYGEAIVELANGMVTDIYTRDNGEIFTITNDNALIKYLKKMRKKD